MMTAEIANAAAIANAIMEGGINLCISSSVRAIARAAKSTFAP